MNIYSLINPTQILHIINRKRDIQPGRVDMVEPDNFIQCAAIRQNKRTYQAHRHIMYPRSEVYITQESWVVVTGLVKVTLFDLDNTVLHTDVLEPGDCSITMQGGHTYEILADDTVVYEFKTGPYLGVNHDKEMI